MEADELATVMAGYIDKFYNIERSYSYIGNMSPAEFERSGRPSCAVPQLA